MLAEIARCPVTNEETCCFGCGSASTLSRDCSGGTRKKNRHSGCANVAVIHHGIWSKQTNDARIFRRIHEWD